MGEPGHRADRGVVRYLVLAALAEQPRHGYDIMQAIAERSGGSYKPSPGVIYPTLQMLDELGHVRSTEADGRKVFAITEEGRRDLAAHRYEVEDFYDRADASSEWEEHAEIFADLATNVARLYRLYRRAARKGRLSGATKRAVRAELDAAIERIESIIDRDST
jgi:DNA-binding PadR family transcriptional regulator